jgi:hypothetical protein
MNLLENEQSTHARPVDDAEAAAAACAHRSWTRWHPTCAWLGLLVACARPVVARESCGNEMQN